MTNLVAYQRLTPNRKVAARAVLFVFPLLLPLAYIAGIQAILAPVFFGIVFSAMIGYLVTPLGPEFWIPASVIAVQQAHGGVPEVAWGVASIVLVDVFTAMFLLWNFDLAERAPLLGSFLDRTEDRCRRFLAEKPWRQRLSVVALALYVALPVPMTGGVVGTTLGRVMGIPRYRAFAIVAASSAAGAFPIAVAAYLVGPAILAAWARGWDTGAALLFVALVLAAFTGGIAYVVRRSRRNHDEAT